GVFERWIEFAGFLGKACSPCSFFPIFKFRLGQGDLVRRDFIGQSSSLLLIRLSRWLSHSDRSADASVRPRRDLGSFVPMRLLPRLDRRVLDGGSFFS